MYWAMLLNLMVYMPTLSLANTVSYNALEQYKCDLVKDFPPIRVCNHRFHLCHVGSRPYRIQELQCTTLCRSKFSLTFGDIFFHAASCPPAKNENKTLLSSFGLDALSLFKRKRWLFSSFSPCYWVRHCKLQIPMVMHSWVVSPKYPNLQIPLVSNTR